jgi:RNA polymerase subunit RPABC4/transcription elongation factor Spt4
MADEKYCFSCDAVIKKAAVMCPKCGVNQSMRSSTSAIDVYCTSCGKMIKKESSLCPFCGVSQGIGASGTNDKKGFAIASLILGINSLWAWLLPFVGFPVAIVGLILGIVGRKSSMKKMAMAGIILSIIGVVATIINSAIGAYQEATRAESKQTPKAESVSFVSRIEYQGTMVRGNTTLNINFFLGGFANQKAVNTYYLYTKHNEPISLEGEFDPYGVLFMWEGGANPAGIFKFENFNANAPVITGIWYKPTEPNNPYGVTLIKK